MPTSAQLAVTETHLCPDVPESRTHFLSSRVCTKLQLQVPRVAGMVPWRVVLGFSKAGPSAVLDAWSHTEAVPSIPIQGTSIPQRSLELQEACLRVCAEEGVLPERLEIAAVLQIASPERQCGL